MTLPAKRNSTGVSQKMKKQIWNILKLSPAIAAATVLSANSALAGEIK